MDGGILSQDEINALLNGMDLSGEANADTSADAPAELIDQHGEGFKSFVHGVSSQRMVDFSTSRSIHA